MGDPAASSAPIAPRYACDLILKGGITSGVVYPPAIVELAKDHRFCSIGGASAGAIGAVSAAAAELGRHSETGGFDLLATLPEQLATTDSTGRPLLQRLFQPQEETAELFDLLWFARTSKGSERTRGLVERVRRDQPAPKGWMLRGLLATVVAIELAVLAVLTSGAGALWAAIPLVVVVGAIWLITRAVGQIVTGARTLAATAPAAVDANFHGLCNGSTAVGAPDAALTPWLYATLQQLAGRDDLDAADDRRATPVTYGELREIGVELVTITTDLSHGTSEMFPLRSAGWAFDEAEMRRLFPTEVVDHLLAKGRAPAEPAAVEALAATGLAPLPDAADLPIVMGARVSLSFPLLISAVPLYAWTPVRADDNWTMEYVRCWLSDGGITSNLPVHLFDAPLPTRPTYAINLSGGSTVSDNDCDNVRRPTSTGQGSQARTARITSTAELLSAVFDTMQNWTDNSLSRVPGQRDRICTVRLGPGEGGMNLDMSAATIRKLAERGAVAGENLASFQRGEPTSCDPPDVLPPRLAHQWERHRFTRYRMFLGAIGRYLHDAKTGADHDFGDEPTYGQLSEQAVTETWYPYRSGWTAARQRRVDEHLGVMLGAVNDDLTDGAPAGSVLGIKPG